MKTLLSILIILCSFGVNAQQEIDIRNNTTMDLDFVFYIYENAPCAQVNTYTVSIPAGGTYTTPQVSSIEEYVWVEISPSSCSGFGLTVGTPMYCNSLCQEPSAPPAVTSTSCSGNYSFVHARWVDCGTPGFGYLGIDEY